MQRPDVVLQRLHGVCLGSATAAPPQAAQTTAAAAAGLKAVCLGHGIAAAAGGEREEEEQEEGREGCTLLITHTLVYPFIRLSSLTEQL